MTLDMKTIFLCRIILLSRLIFTCSLTSVEIICATCEYNLTDRISCLCHVRQSLILRSYEYVR